MSAVVPNRAQQQAVEYRPAVLPPERPKPRRTLSGRTGNPLARWAIEILVALAAFLFIMPVVLIFLTALKPEAEIIRLDSLLPRDPAAGLRDNFGHIFGNAEEVPIFRWVFNSVFVSTSVTLLVLTVDSLAAYALSRLRPPGGRVIFAIILATLMVPGQILLVPVYLILNRLGWLDTPAALIVPAGAGAFGVFLLSQFFKAIPKELEEAAMLDGCGPWGIYWHVMLPLSKPALATLAILTFIASWNDFLGPLVFLESVERYTLPVGVALFQGSYANEYGLTLAASVVCTTPILVIFLLFSRHIIRGMAMSGLKE
jgi:multiple sugar transport system permease protein